MVIQEGRNSQLDVLWCHYLKLALSRIFFCIPIPFDSLTQFYLRSNTFVGTTSYALYIPGVGNRPRLLQEPTVA